MGNLGLSRITYAPDFTSETHPGGPMTFKPEERLQAFSNSYNFWVLDRVETLITDPNAGFAILFLLYPYFQMIARYSKGYAGKKRGDDLKEFADGMNRVFCDEFDGQPLSIKNGVTEHLYYNMRCEIAHGNLTGKGVVLSDDNKPAIWWSNNNGTVNGVGINPRLWYLRIREHFGEYIQTLRVPANEKALENFLKYSTSMGIK